MRKYLPLFGIVLATLFIILLIFIFRKQSPPEIIPPTYTGTGTLPSSGELQIPTTDKILVRGSGGDVAINNVFKIGKLIEGSQYQGVAVKNTDAFDIIYFGKDQFALISIQKKPVLSVRLDAEREFLKLFGITQEQACGMRVSVKTDLATDPNLAGAELGLSFCQKTSQ